jgi:ketosteroid isomerase-like protein
MIEGDSMDKGRAQEWLDSYIEAWRSGDRQQIGDLFSEEAEYRYHPYDEPVRGKQAVVQSWLEDEDPTQEWEVSYQPFVVEGNRMVATGTSRYLPGNGEEERFYYNVFLVEFDDEGRCRDFTEYFVKEPAPESA